MKLHRGVHYSNAVLTGEPPTVLFFPFWEKEKRRIKIRDYLSYLMMLVSENISLRF